jgi:DNA helicase-2/ATP-dependent DNA helicase PcrA
MSLNEEQLKAATHPQGEAALLLAGAGSGKTTTLTRRISWLIEQGVASRRILALTFTNKAAGEIRDRVLKATGLEELHAPRLTTIHSLALSMIRRNPVGFGLAEKVSPLDDYDQNELIKKIILREELDLNFLNVREKISFHRARGVGFRVNYTPEIHKKAQIEHAGSHAMESDELNVWSLFEKEKTATSSIDFDDMLHFVNRRALNDPQWIAKVQQLFDHVLMDESQDTSIVSWEFVNNLLGPNNRNLFVTGDIAQSIYSFNGSSPQLIMNYAEDWRGAAPTLYRLVRNHRSVPEIVNLANAIQDKMTTNTLPLYMESYRGLQGETGKTKLIRADSPRDISERIAYQMSESKKPYKSFAILVRSSLQIRDIEGELVRSRIPYVIRGGRGLLQTEEVRDILSYIRFATNTRDFSALARSIAAPKRGVGDQSLESIRKLANAAFQGDLLESCAASGTKLASYANTIKAIRSQVADPVKALQFAIGTSGYIDHIKKKYSKDQDKINTKIENLNRLKMMIEGLAADSELSTEDLVFQLTMEKVDPNDENGSVTISTIHSAKGLEWDVCFVFNAVETHLPHWRSCGNAEELDEERRLLYVAVTRSRDTCVICIPERVMKGQYLSPVEPSRFLVELGIG